MEIVREAIAGTLESSDLMVRIGPGKGAINITIASIVLAQFGDAIRLEVESTLQALGITDASVNIDDKGALDCVIRARVQAAVARATDAFTYAWEKL